MLRGALLVQFPSCESQCLLWFGAGCWSSQWKRILLSAGGEKFGTVPDRSMGVRRVED